MTDTPTTPAPMTPAQNLAIRLKWAIGALAIIHANATTLDDAKTWALTGLDLAEQNLDALRDAGNVDAILPPLDPKAFSCPEWA